MDLIQIQKKIHVKKDDVAFQLKRFISLVRPPHKIKLEASSICQLRCPMCPTTRGGTKEAIGFGFLKFVDFKQFVDANPSIKHIELSNWGEIFLNPQLIDIIRYSAQKGIQLSARNGVNFNFVKEEVLEALVLYQFEFLSISCDGASEETYALYRKKGSFAEVMSNIRKLNEHKKRHHSKYPILQWQFIVFGHNEHELPLAKQKAESLNMTFKPKLNFAMDFSPVKDEALVKSFMPERVASRKEYLEKFGNTYLAPCRDLWESPQINWDGKLLGCCRNQWGDFGNVFEQGLAKSLKGEKYRYAKKMLLGKAKPRSDIPCFNCEYYRESHRKL